jgi:DNA helicase II / ATP-dependent DNA helicase PcrA
MDFEARYKKLNAAQKQAVDTIDGPVMVVAGPGTGKTELLSMRAANILKKTDTLPENILCLTFTESGASAMRERLVSIIGKDAYKVAIHTFHSFGTEIITQNRAFFYRGADFRPADELSSYEIIRNIFDQLEYSNPLASKMNGEYTHLPDTLRAISELKKSGLTSGELVAVLDQNEGALDIAERLLADIFAPGIKKTTAEQLAPHIDIIRNQTPETPINGITLLSRILADSLQFAVVTATTDNSTKPVTAWRNTWMKKNDRGEFVFKSRDRQAKLRAVSYVYYQYLAKMEEAALYDFDDMILNVVHTIELMPELRFNLQEKHQYIMVDEFQDTNMAQMRILHNLTDNPVNEGMPNVLVVGDDDQAIYSFQGADIGNIVEFRNIYPLARVIALTDNYRSSAPILEHAREIIVQGSDRLENRIPDLNKSLTPHIASTGSKVQLIETDTVSDERSWLVRSIAEHIKKGTPASSIAVLARKHSEIVDLLPYFADANISVNYERRDNVLELDIITHIELLGQTLVALYENRHDSANALLPELMTHPAWHIDPVAIWKLGLNARNNHTSWMEVMAVTPEFLPLHNWLITTAQAVGHLPLERILDIMIGKNISPQSRVITTSPLPADLAQSTPLGVTGEASKVASGNGDDDHTFVSPIFNHFFAPEKLDDQPDEYLTYLEALRTIRSKLREYQPNEQPRLQAFLEFIRLHHQLGSTITSLRPSVEQLDNAVNLMTTHKSKGLEFDVVYITGAIDTTWGERVRTRSSMIGYPENLPLATAGGSLDERLRLFFVGMTRAKKQLTISYSSSDDNNKDTLLASFLTASSMKPQHETAKHTIDTLVQAVELRWYQPLIDIKAGTMQELLRPMLERYKLSATHVGAFLDVTHGGPQGFLLEYLLRFPQAKSPQAAYGTAIHATLQRAHAHLAATESHRAVEDILRDYETNLTDQRLPDDEFQIYLQKGSDALQVFLENKYVDFKTTQKAELDFAAEQSIVGDAHLTGKLDLVDINTKAKTMIVTDYKTGKPVRDWKGKTDYEKIKLHKYRQQLMFYKLLVEHSRNFSSYNVENGVLQFVEPTHSGEIIGLDASFSRDELDEFSRLIQKIWHSIKTLDLPDTNHYSNDYKGIVSFEKDLLESE